MESAVAEHPRRFALPASRRLLGLVSDERLVAEVRAGNAVAFEVVYDRYHRQLLSFCRHLLGSQTEAEDALQQTFVSAYAALLGGGAEVRLKPWLFTIARNRCLSTLRRRPTAELDEAAAVVGLDQQVRERGELRQMLRDLHRLADDQRAALILSELRGFSHSDIAEVLGCPVKRVKSLVFQARTHLIEMRAARDTPCAEIREELSVRRRGAPSRRVRQHVADCAGCAEFRTAVKRQRRQLAVLLPVAPAIGLRTKALASAGAASGAGGGAAASGGAAGLLGSAKIAAIVAAAAGAGALGGVIAEAPHRAGARAEPVQSVPAAVPAKTTAATLARHDKHDASGATGSHARRSPRTDARTLGTPRGSHRGATASPGGRGHNASPHQSVSASPLAAPAPTAAPPATPHHPNNGGGPPTSKPSHDLPTQAQQPHTGSGNGPPTSPPGNSGNAPGRAHGNPSPPDPPDNAHGNGGT